MPLDLGRIPVVQAYGRACLDEGVEGCRQIRFMLLFWACHRADWYDEPVPPPSDEGVGAARRAISREVERAAEAIGERLPDEIVSAFRSWCLKEG